MPPLGTTNLSCYLEDCIDIFLKHYGKGLTAKSVLAEESVKPAFVSSDITSEWKTYRRYIARQPKEDMKAQLKELTTNSMLLAMFHNLSVIANICLSIPVGTTSVEWSFSQMKMIKTRLRNCLGEMSLSLLMKIAIESPKKCLIETWKRSLMSGTEIHDGVLCKISNLHSLREKNNSIPPPPLPPKKNPKALSSNMHELILLYLNGVEKL